MTAYDRTKALRLSGSPYERGLIHGQTLRNEISRLLDVWKSELGNYYKTDPDGFVARILEETDYVTAVEKYTPGLLEEVKGIAEGSGNDFDTIFAFQLLDELLLNGEGIYGEHCSCIGVDRVGDKPPLLGQNWDIGAYMEGFQTILHIQDEASGVESLLFSYAGFIAAFGLNNKGVGICVNSIPQLAFARTGLPVAYVVRGVLEQQTQEDAVRFIHEVAHASPQNYLIGGPDRILDFECSANAVLPFSIEAHPGIVYHTNHGFANTDYNPQYLEFLEKHSEDELEGDNSHSRFDSLQSRLSAPPEEITVDKIKDTLRAKDSDEHPVCMSYKPGAPLYNLGSTVMVLSENPEFHIALGSPDVTPYTVHTFEEK